MPGDLLLDSPPPYKDSLSHSSWGCDLLSYSAPRVLSVVQGSPSVGSPCAKCKAAGDGRMDGDRRRGEKRRRSDQEAHTAGRSPSPAVGQAVSFDKALGSTPSSVVSGLRKHTRSTSLPVGGLQPCFVFFLSFFLALENAPSLPRNLTPPPHLGKVKLYQQVMWAGPSACLHRKSVPQRHMGVQ